jgi:hypothetical protein
MKARVMRGVAALAGGLCMLVGCGATSGQTGSPDCVAPGGCVCEAIHQRAWLRAKIVALDTTTMTARLQVLERLGGGEGAQRVEAGTVVEGTYTAGPNCYQAQVPALQSGEMVLALFNPDFTPTLSLLAFTDPIVFTADLALPLVDVAQVLADDGQGCYPYFATDGPPCDDVVENVGCAIRSRPPAPSAWLVLGPAFLFALRVRRRIRLSSQSSLEADRDPHSEDLLPPPLSEEDGALGLALP